MNTLPDQASTALRPRALRPVPRRLRPVMPTRPALFDSARTWATSERGLAERLPRSLTRPGLTLKSSSFTGLEGRIRATALKMAEFGQFLAKLPAGAPKRWR